MAAEGKLQSKIIKWLKDRGCYVIKTKPGNGTPTGCPDIIFLYQSKWGAIEVKADEHAPWQPLQKPTLDFLKGMNDFVFKVYPENWPEVQKVLQAQFF